MDAGIAERIQEAIRRIGLPAKDVARDIGVSAGAVSHWTSGDVVPSLPNIKKLAVS